MANLIFTSLVLVVILISLTNVYFLILWLKSPASLVGLPGLNIGIGTPILIGLLTLVKLGVIIVAMLVSGAVSSLPAE